MLDCSNKVGGLKENINTSSILEESYYHSKLPKSICSYAMPYVTFIINRVDTPLLNNKSPYKILHDTLPDKKQIKFVGSLCYASTLYNHIKKLACKARKSLFLGYANGFKGSIILDLNYHIYINATFDENIVPYQISKLACYT